MSLFSLADISFNGNTDNRVNKEGTLAPLVNSEFQANTLRYPLDLGNFDKAHYIVFYIRKQVSAGSSTKNMNEAQGGINTPSGGLPSSIPKIKSPAALGSELTSKISNGLNSLNSMTNGALTSINDKINGVVGSTVGSVSNIFGKSSSTLVGSSQETKSVIDNSVAKITGGSFSWLKTTKLTTDAIALYMPDTLQYSYTQNYEDMSVGNELLGKLAAAGQSALDDFRKGNMEGVAASLSKSAGMTITEKFANAAGKAVGSENSARLGSLALLGAVKNPMLEMIYSSPSFRIFSFTFMFYPRDEKEGYEVQRIIERFRYHQAPELEKGSQGFLVPPSEFDIGLYYNGRTNPNLPPIATCVLKGIDVDYAPDGFTAYEVPGVDSPFIGGTGMPVAIRVTLNFQETTYLTKADFDSNLALGAR